MSAGRRAVLLLSGGLDSSTLLFFAREAGFEVFPVAVDYGQRHRREIEAAERVCDHARCALTRLALPSLAAAFRGAALTDPAVEVPHGRYDDDSMRATVVPNRNMVLLSIAGAIAMSRGAALIAYAAHAGDHAIYPDCRPEFVSAMEKALAAAHYSPVRLFTPFLTWKKSEIVGWGAAHEVPLGLTWSCYEGGEKHCGRCGTCVERREAFLAASVSDPTEYEAGDPPA
jgi:7-cyano-7-deazaguanine synthase